MLQVTFGCAGRAGIPTVIGANIKDENYFALRSFGAA
jgi:hypothetical protein